MVWKEDFKRKKEKGVLGGEEAQFSGKRLKIQI